MRIQERVAAILPDFSMVHDKVKEDFIASKRREASEAAYQRLRERYKIIIAQVPDASRVALDRGARQ